MSAMSLPTAVASLQPGVPTSPESALQSWTVINAFHLSMNQFTRVSYLLVASTTGLLASSLTYTLFRAYMPTAERTERTYSTWDKLNSTLSAVLRVFMLISEASIMTILHPDNHYISKETSSMTDLFDWKFFKEYTEFCPKLVVSVQNRFMWIGIGAAVACVTTLLAVRSQSEKNNDSLIKRNLDRFSFVNLGLASLVSICGFVYAKNFSSKMLSSI